MERSQLYNVPFSASFQRTLCSFLKLMVKKFFKTKFKVSTDYLIVLTVITLGIALLSTILGVFTYKNNISSKHNLLEQNALKAEAVISEIINEHHWQIRSIADKIMKSDGSIQHINQIISEQNKFDTNSNFDQFLNQKDLFWVNSDDEIVIKNKLGILEFPQKISKSYEVFNAKEEPWRLNISRDLPSSKNDYSLILTSFGVTDANGKYLGSIVSSIDVNMIQNALIKQFYELKDSRIVVLSSYDNSVVFQSESSEQLSDQKFFTHKLGNLDYTKDQNDFLDDDIENREIRFSYYKKLSNYPLVVLSGYDQNLYNQHLIKSLLRAIYPGILVGTLLIVVLFLFYKRIVQPVNHLASIAKRIGNGNEFSEIKFPKINSPEIFSLAKTLIRIKTQKIKEQKHYSELSKTKDALEEAVEVIKKSDLAQIEIIKHIKEDITKNTSQVYATLKMLKHNIEKTNNPESGINLFLIKNLEQGIQNITKFATDELNKEYTDIRNIISRAVMSQKKEIKMKNISFNVIYDKNTPKSVFVDKVRLTQVVSAVLQKTVALLDSENSFEIQVKQIVRNKTKQLSISIVDDGIGIGFKDYITNAKQIGKKEETSINGIDISVETIEDLIKLHKGEILYKNQIQKGSITTIIIPHIKKVDKITFSNNNYKSDNVIPFPIQNKDQ